MIIKKKKKKKKRAFTNLTSPFDYLVVDVGDVEHVDDIDAKVAREHTPNNIKTHIRT